MPAHERSNNVSDPTIENAVSAKTGHSTQDPGPANTSASAEPEILNLLADTDVAGSCTNGSCTVDPDRDR